MSKDEYPKTQMKDQTVEDEKLVCIVRSVVTITEPVSVF